MKKFIFLSLFYIIPISIYSQDNLVNVKVSKKYLNFPIQMSQERQMMKFVIKNDTITYSEIRLADVDIDYWVFTDVSAYIGKIYIDIKMLIDKTSMEAFIDDRRMYIVKQGEPPGNSEGIVLTSGGDMIIHNLKISEMKSIWI